MLASHLPLLSDIQTVKFLRLGATLSLAYHKPLDPDLILYGLLSGSSHVRHKKLKSRGPFVLAERNCLNNFSGLDIHASQWINCIRNAKDCKNASKLRAFISRTGTSCVGMSFSRTAWFKLNCLRNGVERFHSSMHKWGLAPYQIAIAALLNKPQTTF